MGAAKRAAGQQRPTDADATATRDQSAAAADLLQQPLVLAVGHMGPAYWSWVHKPVPGKPRFFHSTALENITRCPWWVVPLVWVPIYLALSMRASRQLGLPLLRLAALQLQGVVLWQLLEYLIHRFLFHAKVGSYWGITVHFLFHGNHHKFPKDGDRLVFPPLPAAAIASSIYGGLRLLLAADAATGLMSGVILGYIAYDCLHYSMHHAAYLPGSFLQELKARHSHHHYHDPGHGYGISSVVFDVLLRTRASGVC
jgi:dihydroceramide fatty acyl 2-hydroxylase